MRSHSPNSRACWFVASMVVWIAALSFIARAKAGLETFSGEPITCRVLEVHASEQFHVAAVVFHQRDAKDRNRLGELLRQHSEASVQIETHDGHWQDATLVRLKSCFGRGLLLLPAGAVPLAEKDEFLLKLRLEQGS